MHSHAPTARKLLALLSIVMLLSITALSGNHANARILFQNDTEFEMDADNLVIDFDDDTDGTDIYTQFGNQTGTPGTTTITITDGDEGAPDDTFTVLIGGQSSGAVDYDTDNDTTAAAIASAISTNIEGYTAAAVATNVITITADAPGTAYNNVVTVTTTDVNGGTAPAFTGGANITNGADGYGIFNWDITNQRFETQQYFDLNLASGFRMRESSDPATYSKCTTLNELIFDTTDNEIQYCTATGTPGTWQSITAVASGATDAIIQYADDGSATTGQGGNNAGDVYYNTSDGTIRVNDGTGWTIVGPQDFEDVYAYDSDNTLTTSDGDFTINTGNGDFIVDSALWEVDASGLGTFSGGLTVDSGSTVDFSAADAMRPPETTDEATEECTSVGEIVFDTGDNTLYMCTGTGAPGDWIPFGGFGARVDTLVFEPEFPDAVINEPATNNKGKLEATYEGTGATKRHYYKWTTTKNTLQSNELSFRYVLPTDFVAWGDLDIDFKTATTTDTDNRIEVVVAIGATTCDDRLFSNTEELIGTVADTWETETITATQLNAGCAAGTTAVAGSIVDVTFTFRADDSNTGEAFLGNVEQKYNP